MTVPGYKNSIIIPACAPEVIDDNFQDIQQNLDNIVTALDPVLDGNGAVRQPDIYSFPEVTTVSTSDPLTVWNLDSRSWQRITVSNFFALGSITVKEEDDAPTVANVKTVSFDQAVGFSVTDNGDNTVTISSTAYYPGGTDVPITDGGTGASDAATAFGNLKQTATTSATGVVELATTAEVTTGTDTSRAVTPSGLPSQIQDSKWTYAADAEVSDTYVITLSPAPSGYATGQMFSFKANTANTGAATLNVNSLGAVTIKKLHDQDLATGDIESGQIVVVQYDGTNFQMQSQLAASSSPNLWATLAGDTGSTTANTTTDTATLAGGAGIVSSVSGDTITHAMDINPLTDDGEPDNPGGDYLPIYDSGGTAIKKVSVTNLIAAGGVAWRSSSALPYTSFKPGDSSTNKNVDTGIDIAVGEEILRVWYEITTVFDDGNSPAPISIDWSAGGGPISTDTYDVSTNGPGTGSYLSATTDYSVATHGGTTTTAFDFNVYLANSSANGLDDLTQGNVTVHVLVAAHP